MLMNDAYIDIFYGFIGVALLAGSFWVPPKAKGWLFYVIVIIIFTIGVIIIHSYFLGIAGLLAGAVSLFRYRRNILKNRKIEVVLINDHDDHYLHHFLNYYHDDILKYFPTFDFRIEEEYLVALLLSDMETVGLIVAEIKNAETLKICIDYIIPKYNRSQLAKTFYSCELRCVDFLGFKHLCIEPQSKVHNNYLERVGFRLKDGKYVNSF